MPIEYYLDKYNIQKSEFGSWIGYTTKQGIYTALKNERQRPLLYTFLLIKLLRIKGVNPEKLLDSLETTKA